MAIGLNMQYQLFANILPPTEEHRKEATKVAENQ